MGEFRRILLRKFPGVPIVGKVYPPGDDKIMIATVAQYGFFIGIGVIFFGQGLFKAMGMAQPPAWYAAVQENKMQACMFLWIANSLATSQLATGAFEIWYDGDLIFSKLEERRWPDPMEVIRALEIRGVPTAGRNDNSF